MVKRYIVWCQCLALLPRESSESVSTRSIWFLPSIVPWRLHIAIWTVSASGHACCYFDSFVCIPSCQDSWRSVESEAFLTQSYHFRCYSSQHHKKSVNRKSMKIEPQPARVPAWPKWWMFLQFASVPCYCQQQYPKWIAPWSMWAVSWNEAVTKVITSSTHSEPKPGMDSMTSNFHYLHWSIAAEDFPTQFRYLSVLLKSGWFATKVCFCRSRASYSIVNCSQWRRQFLLERRHAINNQRHPMI